MKTNTVSVDKANKVTNVVTTVSIPFKNWDNDTAQKAILHWGGVLYNFSNVIIKALEDRKNACMSMLSKNIFNIVYSNEYTIVFKKENGSYHSFNHQSYEVMEEAITIFNDDEIHRLELRHFEQIMKALVWVENREDVENISFGNLVSCIMELIINARNESELNSLESQSYEG